jgi:pyridoxal phosphate phosphatase PHOSPHO2
MTTEEAPAAPMNSDVVVIFDFDWSLINENTDTYVIEKLAPDLYAECLQLRKELQWTKLMDLMVGRLHAEHGVTKDTLSLCLRGIPYFEEMFQAAKVAADRGAKLFIISDSNHFYIQEILQKHDMVSLWTKVFTNEVYFEGDRLRVLPYHDPAVPHSCRTCPVNICKGNILSSILAELGPSETRRVIYVGDGGGDLCPCLRLDRNGTICCRKGWKLHTDLLAADSVKASIEPWENGADVLSVFARVIN